MYSTFYDVEKYGKIDTLAVVGPTATGKTRLSISLAKELNGEIISADSIQIYKGLNIGTAKPTKEELDEIHYHLIDFVDPKSTTLFSVANYVNLAKSKVLRVKKCGHYPIVCGGTGLYIKSLLENIHFFENTRSSSIRRKIEIFLESRGKDYVYSELTKIDPVTASKIHKNNAKRVIRALEFFALTGSKISDQVALSKSEKLFDTVYVGLKYRNKANLIKRINDRVDDMFKKGLIEETRYAVHENYNRSAMSAIGYKEIIPYIRGEKNLAETIERVKISTRQYAKRQMTWFKKNSEIRWFNVDDYQNFDALLSEVKEYVKTERARKSAKTVE